MKLSFRGAAGQVTGSMHIVESSGRRLLLDCGMAQGRRKEAERQNREFPFDAGTVDAVVLSHAHIDHSGRLPLLVKQGFNGPIFATPASIDLCDAMLRDTGHIQESDAEFVNDHHPGDDPVEPLYTVADAVATMPHFQPVGYGERSGVIEGVGVEVFDAGHILGSSFLVLNDGKTRLGFSGDLGRPGLPIIRDPQPLPQVDYLILESTYGGRKHATTSQAKSTLEKVMRETIGRGGRLIVPAFAVGRTQQLVLMLHELMNEKRLPAVPIFVDSPLAVDVTKVFRGHPECFDEGTLQYLQNGEDPFGFHRLTYIRDSAESRKLNDLKGPFVVISPSGMCEAGRVLHHLRHNADDSKNTILITGYQAENTLGRRLLTRPRDIRVLGGWMPLRAQVESLDALSGHADQEELLSWMAPRAAGIRRVFLVHGEPAQSAALAAEIGKRFGVEAVAPRPGDSFEL
jgi:metallo-beta-lactamase family protein